MKLRTILGVLTVVVLASCSTQSQQADTEVNETLRGEVDAYLNNYNKEMQTLYYNSAEAAWALNTRIMEGDTMNSYRASQADEAFAKFTGSEENINTARKFLEQRDELTSLQVKQLEKILYAAANNPQTEPELVKRRIKLENAQTEDLFGYKFMIDGKKVSTNYLDSVLNHSTKPEQRLKVWQESKEVGAVLKDNLAVLRDLRNQTVQALGYPDYFTYQVSDYNMSNDEMLKLNEQFIKELWPLYRELHTYARYELAKKYGVKQVPDMIPAHWLPNRWEQDWSSMIEVEGLNLDSMLETKSAEWVVQKGEEFYKSLGFSALPKSFYEKSSLYPLPEGAHYSKNNHASAWHMDLQNDVRSLMSVKPNAEWYETVNHELGHIYYYMTYSNPDVPLILREGANRAYHEAIGTQIGLAAMQKPFLAENGLLPANAETDTMQTLLKQAMNYVVFIPFSAGVMTHFERDLYSNNLSKDEINARWWKYKNQYQGIESPAARGEKYCDACSKTHINNDAAQYYDYALSFVLLFQLHDHISKNILHQNPRNANYYNSKEVGNFLRDIMQPGASRDWREVLVEKTGSDLSAKAMLEYFDPLMDYLKKENQGRKYALPETI